MSHTKEPWKVVNRGDNECSDIDAKGPDGWPGDVTVAMNIGKANARRIVDCVNVCAGIPEQILTAVGAFGGFGRDHMVNHVTKQRDDLLSALEDIAKITYDAGFNIGGPLEHFPGSLPEDEAKRLLSLACEYLEDTSKAAGRAIAMVKGNHSGDATNMVDDTSAPAIVFYPAGSLGEAVESEGGEA